MLCINLNVMDKYNKHFVSALLDPYTPTINVALLPPNPTEFTNA